jgi:hypothetical protein
MTMGTELLEHYQRWSSLSTDQRPSFIDYLKRADPWVFSHHPHDACFREHVWQFNDFYWCKGCVVTSLGFAAGVTAQLLSGWLALLPEEALGIVFFALLVPTLIASASGAPRGFKHVARFLLGALIASALLLVFLTDRWDVRLIIIITYVVTKFGLEKIRAKQNATTLRRCHDEGQ